MLLPGLGLEDRLFQAVRADHLDRARERVRKPGLNEVVLDELHRRLLPVGLLPLMRVPGLVPQAVNPDRLIT